MNGNDGNLRRECRQPRRDRILPSVPAGDDSDDFGEAGLAHQSRYVILDVHTGDDHHRAYRFRTLQRRERPGQHRVARQWEEGFARHSQPFAAPGSYHDGSHALGWGIAHAVTAASRSAVTAESGTGTAPSTRPATSSP